MHHSGQLAYSLAAYVGLQRTQRGKDGGRLRRRMETPGKCFSGSGADDHQLIYLYGLIMINRSSQVKGGGTEFPERSRPYVNRTKILNKDLYY